jgi:hypothetical protein
MVYSHEFGHDFGLNHAQLSDGSGDYSSMMSATGWQPNLEGPLKCYNAANNAYLGWFEDRTLKVDPLETPAQTVNLVAFAEWDEGNQVDPILLEIGE